MAIYPGDAPMPIDIKDLKWDKDTETLSGSLDEMNFSKNYGYTSYNNGFPRFVVVVNRKTDIMVQFEMDNCAMLWQEHRQQGRYLPSIGEQAKTPFTKLKLVLDMY